MLDQPLYFYTDKTELEYLSTICKDECIYKNPAPNDTLLPFIIKRQSSPDKITAFKVWCPDESNDIVLNVSLLDIALTTVENGVKYDYIVYDGSELGVTIPCGYHQAVVFTENSSYYSELFYVGTWSADNSPFIRVDYVSDCAVQGIPYPDLPDGFNFYFFLQEGTNWGLPQVAQDIFSEEDNFGRTVQQGLKFSTNYTLQTGSIPFYMVKTWVIATMHKQVFLTGEDSGEQTEIFDIVLTHTPDVNGCTHEVDLLFKTQESLTKGSCCDEVQKAECYSAGTVTHEVVELVDPNYQPVAEGIASVGEKWFIKKNPIVCPGFDWCNNSGSVAEWDGAGWIYYPLEDDEVFYDLTTSSLWYFRDGNTPTQIPFIVSVTETSPDEYDIVANVAPCYFGRIEFSFDGGSTWVEEFSFTKDELDVGVIVDTRDPNANRVRIVMWSYNCPDIIGNEIVI